MERAAAEVGTRRPSDPLRAEPNTAAASRKRFANGRDFRFGSETGKGSFKSNSRLLPSEQRTTPWTRHVLVLAQRGRHRAKQRVIFGGSAQKRCTTSPRTHMVYREKKRKIAQNSRSVPPGAGKKPRRDFSLSAIRPSPRAAWMHSQREPRSRWTLLGGVRNRMAEEFRAAPLHCPGQTD